MNEPTKSEVFVGLVVIAVAGCACLFAAACAVRVFELFAQLVGA